MKLSFLIAVSSQLSTLFSFATFAKSFAPFAVKIVSLNRKDAKKARRTQREKLKAECLIKRAARRVHPHLRAALAVA
jgi:hypothetical protein